MFSYRLRGLVNLHIAAVSVIATGYFVLLALAVPYLPKLDLNHINLLLYASPIALGMLLSGRYWKVRAARFHLISWWDSVAISGRQILVVALFIFGLIVATKDREISRVFLAGYLGSCWILLIVVNLWLPRFLAAIAFPKDHRLRAVLVGSAATANRLLSWVNQKEHIGIDVVGLVSEEKITPELTGALRLLGKVSDLRSIIDEYNISQVVVLDLSADTSRTLFFIECCQAVGCRLLIHQNVWDLLPVPMVPVIEGNNLFLTVHDEPLEDPFNRGLKRLFDIAVATPVVVLILPPLSILVAIGQLFQAPGPLLFSRRRGGHRRRDFLMLKYRSMYLAPPDQKLEAQQATSGDRRIYPLGAFLRKTSLDEFPQFWNVLMGDMSIVGPRPHLTQHDEEFSQVAKAYRTRQLVKPGLTGLAQIYGFRGEIRDPEMLHQRVQLDIQYITQWSLSLDIKIVIKTFLHVLRPPKGAV